MDKGCGEGQAPHCVCGIAVLDVRAIDGVNSSFDVFFIILACRCINKGKIEAQPQMCLRHFINGAVQPFPSQFANLPPPPPYNPALPAGDQAASASSATAADSSSAAASHAAPAQSSEVCISF